MKATSFNLFCRFLMVALLTLSFQTSQAGMIGVEQLVASTSVQSDRATVLNLLSRAETVNELQALGLDAQIAKDRVAAMTDDEVKTIAGKMSAEPAGGIIALILVVFFIWYFAFRK